MDPFELYAIDGLLTDEERAIRDTVRDFGARELRPHVATWFDEGRVPARDLAKQLGALGILSAVWFLGVTRVSNEFTGMTPYVATLLVLAFASQRLRPPAADGQVYRKGEAS